MKLALIALSAAAALAAAAPAALAAPPEESPRPTLFQRLGGQTAIRCISGRFLDNLASNSKLMSNPRYRQVAERESKIKVKTRLAEWICKLTGGPCKPKHALLDHPPQGVKPGPMDWLTLVGEANRALDACHIHTREKGEMIEILFRNRNS